MSYKTIPADQLPPLIEEEHIVIDVRTPAEYRAEHVVGAQLHPLDQLDAEAFCRQYNPDTPIYVLCQSGKRASMAAEKLIAAGHQNVHVVEGGTNAAKTTGVAMNRGKGAISIERQVRIGAGALVVLGTIAGLTIHAGFLAVPLFVGSGLIFAGVTDICGMGAVLAKMPWNR
ncbi:sulfurtransferase [Coraliomargarita sinensis]|uniref:Sulfurtransferase n=1 Tax=Coraliomargarita sinensis TaxID=2174842 RepID=A0A317ZJ40_9BACT|nr:rhodanese-like domain-containing protein [Coraliomargarita sinensis]PXA04243.1 sulfurtransferase [Coraliomargarita sinensis]